MKQLPFSLAHNRWVRLAIALGVFAGVFVALWFGPNWNTVGDAFQGVRWAWVAVAMASPGCAEIKVPKTLEMASLPICMPAGCAPAMVWSA